MADEGEGVRETEGCVGVAVERDWDGLEVGVCECDGFGVAVRVDSVPERVMLAVMVEDALRVSDSEADIRGPGVRDVVGLQVL